MLKTTTCLREKFWTQYGLNSRKRPPPVGDNLGLTFWVVFYGRFNCILYVGKLKKCGDESRPKKVRSWSNWLSTEILDSPRYFRLVPIRVRESLRVFPRKIAVSFPEPEIRNKSPMIESAQALGTSLSDLQKKKYKYRPTNNTNNVKSENYREFRRKALWEQEKIFPNA